MSRRRGSTWVALTTAMLVSIGVDAAEPTRKDATPATVAVQKAAVASLPFANRQDFEDARRGFIATIPNAEVKAADGRVVWDLAGFRFLEADRVPDSVNPSLWRQSQLNQIHGLFRVVDRVYQIRGFDLSNMTIIEGGTGLIVIDPMISAETAKAGLDLYRKNRPAKPVVAVIYTHSHADHFGGVRGVIDEADVKAGKVAVIAPSGFLEHAVSENVIAGNAMSRRAIYMYGATLPPNEKARVDAGLGKGVSTGNVTLIAPTVSIEKPLERRTVDGVEMEFQLTPGTEAPSEMNIYLPQLRVLNMAENVTHTMHNLYTLRGAQIRDAVAWSGYIDETREMYAGKSDIMIAQHHWPKWGSSNIDEMLRKQRDLYKYIHDQSVRLLNQGYTPREIAEQLKLPPSLENEWSLRGYYGTVSHNSKAVYQKYLGWYDANPANLNPLPPAESARRTVEYMGGTRAVIERARADFAKGNYRWVAEVMNHVVFADPANDDARSLAADALEQLGYQSESANWRNVYLTAAQELRVGKPKIPPVSTTSPDVIRAIPLGMFFDYLAVRLNPAKAEGKRIVINWNLPDTKQQARMNLENSALTYMLDKQAPNADVTVTLNRSTLDLITLRQKTFQQAAAESLAKLQGDGTKLQEVLGMLDEFNPMFDIVTPNPVAAASAARQ